MKGTGWEGLFTNMAAIENHVPLEIYGEWPDRICTTSSPGIGW